ncbi:MAG: DUF3828 domain-containing protein [Acidobacteriota bacterium]
MKKPALILVAITLFALTAGQTSAAMRSDPKTPDEVIRVFYKWYITAIDGGTDPFTKDRTTLKRYVTQRFITQIERDEKNGFDADELLQTQDLEKEWADSVNVSKISIRGASATAIVTFGTENYPRVTVTLLKEAGVWKIDRVRNAAQ